MKQSRTGYVRKLESMGMVDGPGIRTIAFLSGCPLRCLFCHNPDMWRTDPADEITVEALVDKLKRYKPYYGKDGGVTFCGGEPLNQPEFLYEAMKACKAEGISTCLDTSGFGRVDTFDDILSVTDTILYDIKGLEEKKYREMTSAPLRVTQQFLEKAQAHNVPIWIRVVIVPGFHDNYQYMNELADYIAPLNNIERIELLPYHTMGVNKYETIGKEYPLEGVPAMNKDTCMELQEYLINKVDVIRKSN
ncbi:pyruvate formate lyase-activating protein [Erysipelothrix sp. HDW6C]|uniref:pyruvate formate-lyase-activating protein n=1 Tax=Erysipelothrix sp. HDW6C TaxID=2714930 RepID=UPI00140E02CE|nr:pyruvate formate-lyase-activating protein [Erysipelothrix sp. HDW6C]QIK68983.1 pyruvate formate lyase-activating protein [Erysipelothrix sp. HDW6C]